MTDQGSSGPRRALGPLPDDLPAVASQDFRTPASRAYRAADADEATAVSTSRLRRLAAPPKSSGSPDDLPRDPSPSTPVPPPTRAALAAPAPPAPVLPDSATGLPASAGRRFSASAEPSELVAAPRRSAASVSTPTSPVTPVRSWTSRPSPTAPKVIQGFEVPTPAPVAQDSEPPSFTAPRAVDPPPAGVDPAGTRGVVEPGGERRRSRRAIAVIGGVVAIALIVAGVVWGLNQNGASTTPIASASQPQPALDPLLTEADVAGLASASWQVSTTQPTPGSAYPLCIPATAEGMPVPDRTAERLITSTSTQTDSVKNAVETYADAATAAKAYQERVVQAGTCPDTEALIVSSYSISDLADAALGSQVRVQATQTEYHTLVISQSGRNLSLVDVLTTEKPVGVTAAARVAAKPLARLCSGGEGACPGTLKVTRALPAAGALAGWLVEADLPRITAGAGRWGATDPSKSLSIVGSQCEAVNLQKVTGTTAAAQRTMLLADDSAAPTGFGVDQVTYTFPTESAAKRFVTSLTSNLKLCPSRVPTATVEAGPNVKGTGADKVAITGSSFQVTQKTGADGTFPFRVAIITVGTKVGYLVANPSTTFDFTDDQWKDIVLRAGQRISQAP
ncbi:MAG: hypothetical protein WCF12_16140 [Propionicimonas sp.]